MNQEQRLVHSFHERYDLPRNEVPTWPGDMVLRQRILMLEEELAELRNSAQTHDLAEVADALADLLHVAYGTAIACGIDLEPIFAEIHRANMTKDRHERRPDGKPGKGPAYMPPDIQPLLEKQRRLAAAATR
ncbi:MAG: nucleotide pyrophosphohydrolase [Candidatus Dormibacteraeota bacterium]|nr:nucleotide pyrophosphohydrolase [Candidatus Dormibacteraeota bacterium]